MTKSELLLYMRRHRLAVAGSIAPDGRPQAALVGIATTDAFDVVFDTVSDSRKHRNLLGNPLASVTFSGPGEQTLQFEGVALPVSMGAPKDQLHLAAYYAAWPECVEHRSWPKIAYWRIEPRWARYSDYDRGPLIVEFGFD